MRNDLSPQDYQTLSDYLDGQLSSRDRSRLEARLTAQPLLKEELEEIRRLRLMLRSLPKRRAPRNFTLTPAMVGSTRPARPQPTFNLFPAFRLASVVAAVLFVFALVGPMALGTSRQTGAKTAAPAAGTGASESAPVTAPQAGELTGPTATAGPLSAAPSTMAGAQADEGSKIITWGFPFGMGGGGGGDGGVAEVGGGVEIDPQTGLPVQNEAPLEPNAGLVAATPVPLAQVAPDLAQAPVAAPGEPGSELRTFGETDTSVENSGPIIGLQKAAAGSELVPTLPNPTLQPTPAPAADRGAPQPTTFPGLLAVQVSLGFLAVLTALAAFYFYRKERL